ncbi:AAA family ATPase [Desulfopila sp. IMCC35008]|uniref:AAA family ATPase n=1 Tax=Desulfopila sp. IMCC35008 TaxID=2653858 RepID=UPI0013D09C0A|nr:AAA family ATPase [Desulfopila sp. IMCC35008]
MTRNVNLSQWTEKYRAKTLDELVVSSRIKEIGYKIIESGQLQNLLLVGGHGVGKTSFAEILIDSLDVHALTAKTRGMDDIRSLYEINSITSVLGSKYIAFIDEADMLLAAVQKEMLKSLEGYKTGIQASILIANDVSRIHEGIRSRTIEIDFEIRDYEKIEVGKLMLERVLFILDSQDVSYSEKWVVNMVKGFYESKGYDIRNFINELQSKVNRHNVL